MGDGSPTEGAEAPGGGAVDDTVPHMVMPWIESPFFDRELSTREARLTAEQREIAVSMHERGFAPVRGAVAHDLCDRVRREVEPMFSNPTAIERRRVADAWKAGADSVRELAVLPNVLDLLAVLYERRPIPFQTLDFKWGTEQRGHSDSIHFSCIPARFMCGVWVALEDVDASNGPLFYFPSSQRLPEYTAYDLGYRVGEIFYPKYEEFQHRLMDELGIEPLEFHAAKGDALIWSSNVVHGGRPVHRKGSTRWSQVSHYFFEGCIYYQPHTSEIPTGELRLLEVTDLTTMTPVLPSYNGHRIRVSALDNGRSRLWFDQNAAPSPQPRPSRARRLAAKVKASLR